MVGVDYGSGYKASMGTRERGFPGGCHLKVKVLPPSSVIRAPSSAHGQPAKDADCHKEQPRPKVIVLNDGRGLIFKARASRASPAWLRSILVRREDGMHRPRGSLPGYPCFMPKYAQGTSREGACSGCAVQFMAGPPSWRTNGSLRICSCPAPYYDLLLISQGMTLFILTCTPVLTILGLIQYLAFGAG